MLTSAVVSRITWSLSLNQTKSKSQTHQIGKAFVLSWDDDQVYPWEPVVAPSRWTLPEWGCPSLAFIVGTVSLRNLTNSTKDSTGPQPFDKSRIAVSHGNLSALVCTQNLQQVETDVTLDYPSMAINKNKPPRPDEATSKWIRNSASKQGGTAFQFVPKNMMISLNSPNVSSDSVDGSTEELDRFVQAATYVAQKEEGLNSTNLFGIANLDNMVSALQKMYGRYMAQALSNNMRVSRSSGDTPNANMTSALWIATASPIIIPTPSPSSTSRPAVMLKSNGTTPVSINSTSGAHAANISTISLSTETPGPIHGRAANPESTLSGTLIDTGTGARYRLKQNRASKIALQVMLAVMSLGVILMRLLQRTRQTLQREPYSIAGRAVLVANGNMVDALGHDWERAGLADKKFSLKWIKDGNGDSTYGIWVDGPSKKM
jgi:hypothetical protein